MKESNSPQRRATDLKSGESSVISHFESDGHSAQFLEIGCRPNAPIQLVRFGPGKTVYLKVSGHAYAFRHEEALQIILKY